MFDISNPQRPRLIKALDLGQGSGPHYIALTDDERRLVISDHFLNEDNFGKVHAEGGPQDSCCHRFQARSGARSAVCSRLQQRLLHGASAPAWNRDQGVNNTFAPALVAPPGLDYSRV